MSELIDTPYGPAERIIELEWDDAPTVYIFSNGTALIKTKLPYDQSIRVVWAEFVSKTGLEFKS